MDEYSVSVIISFLNPGKWLTEAVDSVINQTYSNWELILVDDGSVEVDSNVALHYAKEYPNQIKYRDHPGHRNIGLTASRNVGIQLATGYYIAFLDADDYWYTEKLRYQLRIFKKFPLVSMVCEASRFWYSWNNPLEHDPIITIGASAGLYQPGILIRQLYPLGQGQPPCPSGIILKKKAVMASGGFEEAFSGIYQLYEDQAFLAKMYVNEVIYISDIPHNKYRKHEGSMTGAGNDLKLYNQVRKFYMAWLSDYLFGKSIHDEELNGLIHAAWIDLE